MTQANALTITTRGEREIIMTRAFAAPRRFVFDAFTKPELLKRWLYGPEGNVLEVCEVDLRVGGAYRYVWRSPDGSTMGAGGVYREVVAPERLVNTERFDEAWYPGESLITVDLAEEGGTTLMTQTLLYESREARDAVAASDMEDGLVPGYGRLEAIVVGLAQEASANT